MVGHVKTTANNGLMLMSLQIPFSNAYATLPENFFRRETPTAVKAPVLQKFNKSLATELGFDVDGISDEELADVFGGNAIPAGADPLAMAYSGHQFGNLNPTLGDGRAILLGDLIDSHGQRRDIQLKGAGTTAFSRMGDGRSPLGPAMREYILCEAMYALGVPTTRALALVSTGEKVVRDRLEPGAVFTRVAASHIRVGTFQFLALNGDADGLKVLADHIIERHYPDINSNADDRYVQLFRAVCKRQAELIAKWMNLGFIHGVMNTDNMTISGETIDYGPCAFMDTYHAAQVFSSIDRQGRYAYQNQPAIGQWNLARLAEPMLSLFDSDQKEAIAKASAVLKEYPDMYESAWRDGFNRKLGFKETVGTDQPPRQQLLDILERGEIDFTLFFRHLSHLPVTQDREPVLELITVFQGNSIRNELNEWLDQWLAQLTEQAIEPAQATELMNQNNPAIIPRNHRVAEAIKAAEGGDYSVFENLLKALEKPYEELAEFEDYQKPPQPEEAVIRTFCGT